MEREGNNHFLEKELSCESISMSVRCLNWVYYFSLVMSHFIRVAVSWIRIPGMHNAIFGVKFFQKPVLVEVYMQGMNNIICFFDRAELFFLESFVTQWVNIFLDELLIIDYLAELSFISFWTIDCSIHVANCCIGCRKDLYGLKIFVRNFCLRNLSF